MAGSNPHICYYDAGVASARWSLKHAYKTSTGWIVEVVDPDLKHFWQTWGCSIAIDHHDRIHVGYYGWKYWDKM